ncbi:BTB domain-containing protein [Mycena kentingensis (nom. inval.)]|nr:BTB domain-containing protein [Mycena kentingensis (nom. inval.)]
MTDAENKQIVPFVAQKLPVCQIPDCKLVVDVVFRSSDGSLCGAHAKTLEIFAEGFPPASLLKENEPEVVQLTEDSKTLELLLQYLHAGRHPALSSYAFPTVASLAEAVEKYQVYGAIELCKVRMELSVQNHSLEVLAYAVKHNYRQLANQAAPLTLKKSFQTIRRALPVNGALAWAQYRDECMELMRKAINVSPPVILHKGGRASCEEWPEFYMLVRDNFTGNLDNLEDYREMPHFIEAKIDKYLGECKNCQRRAQNWSGAISRQILHEHAPDFTSCL